MERERFDEIHEIYVRMAEIGEAILSHPRFKEAAMNPDTGELLGLVCGLGQAAAKLKVFTVKQIAADPEIYQIWLDVLAKPKG